MERSFELQPRPVSRDRVRILILSGLEELGIPEDPLRELPERLADLTDLVFDWSQRTNLTGHREREEIARRLVLDAVALDSILPEGRSLVDLGSGAGFPGLPIALLRPGVQVTLVEPRERRHHFQRHAIRSLGLPNARALLGRAEQLAAFPNDLVLAQAVGRPQSVLGWMLPWVGPGGWAVIPGRRALSLLPTHEIVHTESRRYRVPLGGPEHPVWLGKRSRAIPTLPRPTSS